MISILINSDDNLPDSTVLITLPSQYKNASGHAYADLFDQSGGYMNGRICITPDSNNLVVYWTNGLKAGQQMRGNVIYASR